MGVVMNTIVGVTAGGAAVATVALVSVGASTGIGRREGASNKGEVNSKIFILLSCK